MRIISFLLGFVPVLGSTPKERYEAINRGCMHLGLRIRRLGSESDKSVVLFQHGILFKSDDSHGFCLALGENFHKSVEASKGCAPEFHRGDKKASRYVHGIPHHRELQAYEITQSQTCSKIRQLFDTQLRVVHAGKELHGNIEVSDGVLECTQDDDRDACSKLRSVSDELKVRLERALVQLDSVPGLWERVASDMSIGDADAIWRMGSVVNVAHDGYVFRVVEKSSLSNRALTRDEVDRRISTLFAGEMPITLSGISIAPVGEGSMQEARCGAKGSVFFKSKELDRDHLRDYLCGMIDAIYGTIHTGCSGMGKIVDSSTGNNYLNIVLYEQGILYSSPRIAIKEQFCFKMGESFAEMVIASSLCKDLIAAAGFSNAMEIKPRDQIHRGTPSQEIQLGYLRKDCTRAKKVILERMQIIFEEKEPLDVLADDPNQMPRPDGAIQCVEGSLWCVALEAFSRRLWDSLKRPLFRLAVTSQLPDLHWIDDKWLTAEQAVFNTRAVAMIGSGDDLVIRLEHDKSSSARFAKNPRALTSFENTVQNTLQVPLKKHCSKRPQSSEIMQELNSKFVHGKCSKSMSFFLDSGKRKQKDSESLLCIYCSLAEAIRGKIIGHGAAFWQAIQNMLPN